MKRKFLVVFLAIVATFCMAFGLAACGEKEPEKEQADLWSMERVYATAQELGFKGTLEELIAMFKGEKGENGKDGKDGQNGKDGLGIQSLEIDENGHLKVTLSDGTVKDAGKVTPDASPAEEGTEGLQYQKRKDENGNEYAAVVSLGMAWDTDIVIPSTYRGLPVKEIADRAFGGDNSDDRTTNLSSVFIPDSITKIGSRAFGRCDNLKEVHISDLAAWCRIEFEDNPLSYAHHLFMEGKEITKLDLPAGLTEIGSSAFYGCSGLTGELKIPDSVTSIGSSAFAWCSGLNSITIPNNVTSIGWGVFRGCSGLISITIPDSVTEIGEGAFENCSGLTSVTIPHSVTEIGDDAFEYCYKLVEVWNYSNLQIEEGSKENGYIGAYAFKVYTTNEASKQTKTSDGYLFYEDGTESYLLGYIGTSTELTLPAQSPKENNYEINQFAFAKCNNLTSITISSGVTSIGESAFYDCSGLNSITIPNNVTSIGRWAFENCSGLTSVTIPHSVTEIGGYAFYGCSGLTSITIGSGVTSIGSYAFLNCSGLTSVNIPDSVTEIGNEAFEGCSELNSVTIGSGVTSIGVQAFEGCNKLKEVHFENPNGWKVSRNKDMSDTKAVSGLDSPATAAEYLTDTYRNYYWEREE